MMEEYKLLAEHKISKENRKVMDLYVTTHDEIPT